MTGAGPVVRKVARVVLLDPEDRVLLLHGHEPEDPDLSWWFTPAEDWRATRPGKRRRCANSLRRPASPTSTSAPSSGPGTAPSPSPDGWDQDEWYYLARTRRAGAAPGPRTLTELETRSLSGLRWWTSAELSAARETVYPTRLAELLRTLLDEGPPRAPVVLAPEIV